MSYIAPIGQANLIERLGTIPLPYPSYVTVIPTDSTYATDDTSISNVIRSQSDYVTVINPYTQLHSLMQNEFYQEFCDTLVNEYQYMIDNANELKTLYNIDYYDGDQDTLFDKINNIATEFGMSLPLLFVPYTNVENASGLTLAASANITKQNDFLRNIVKRIWLMRRWTGSLYGYKLPVKFINRIGAIHLGLQTLSVGSFTNRIYRLVDVTQYNVMFPASSTFPNSVNIPGAESFNLVKNSYLYWDTLLTWDSNLSLPQNDIKWDVATPIPNSGKRLFIELSLDRIINYINSIESNPSVCLVENVYLDTITELEKYVDKVQDVINIGCQLSLTTSKDGYYNTFSSAAATPSLVYSHPNIQAKFQVFPNWSIPALSASGSYIKIGTGGFAKNGTNSNPVVILQSTATSGSSSSLTDTTQNWSTVNWATYSIAVKIIAGTGIGNVYTVASNTSTQLTFNTSSYTTVLDSTSVYQIIGTVDLNVFNSCGLNGSSASIPAKALVQLKDLQSPVFSSPLLVTNEIANLGLFTLINNVIHSRDLSFPNATVPVIANNVTTTISTAYTTCISLPNMYVALGSVELGINLNITIPAPTITQSNNSSNINIALLPSKTKNTYYYSFSISNTTVSENIYINGNTNTATIPISSQTTIAGVMGQLVLGLVSNPVYDWKTTVVGNILTLSSTLQEIHQKVNIFEQYNPANQSYIPKSNTLSLQYLSYQTPIISNNTSGVGFSAITTNNYPYSFVFQITSLNSVQTGQSFELNGVIIPVYSDDTYESIAKRIASITLVNWNILWGVTSAVVSNVTVYSYYIYMTYSNPYRELNNYSIFSGYTTDSYYEQYTSHSYLSTAQMQCISLLPLFGIDTYPSLYNNLVGDYRIDDSSTTALTNYSFGAPSGTSTGVTTGTNGYIPLGSSGITSYYYVYAGSGYSTVSNTLNYNQDMPNTTTGMTIAFSYNVNSHTAQSNSVIVAKQNAGLSGGWGLYYTYAAGVGTLTLNSVSTGGSGGTNTWSRVIPTSGWHRILITLSSISSTSIPSASIYIDGILSPFTSSTTYFGPYSTDSSYSLSIGGFSTPSNNFTGQISDIKLWNRLLLSYEINNESSAVLSRLTYLLDINGNSQYITIDHATGTVGIKFQYNPSGLLSNSHTASITSKTNFSIDENYSLAISNTPIPISELGVFDSNNNLMAYATFPSIIYNPENYHLALNLLVQN